MGKGREAGEEKWKSAKMVGGREKTSAGRVRKYKLEGELVHPGLRDTRRAGSKTDS